MLVGRELNKLYSEFPGLQVEKIDVLVHPRRTLAAGVRMIPALKAGNRMLSGLFLTSAEIRKFLSTPAD